MIFEALLGVALFLHTKLHHRNESLIPVRGRCRAYVWVWAFGKKGIFDLFTFWFFDQKVRSESRLFGCGLCFFFRSSALMVLCFD